MIEPSVTEMTTDELEVLIRTDARMWAAYNLGLRIGRDEGYADGWDAGFESGGWDH